MTKNKLRLSLAAAMMITTYSYAGSVTAPNVDNIAISGDIELKQVREKSDTATVSFRTAEINLNIDATVADIVDVYTQFQVYDDTQAKATADKTFDVVHAYAVLPIMKGKGKVMAGLIPNITYGTDAFDDGGEDWNIMIQVPVAKGVKVAIISKVKNEEEADKNKGDTGANAIRIDAKISNFMLGAKYAQGHANKGDGFAGLLIEDKEKKSKVFMTYITGKVAGFDVGFEYAIKDITLQNTPIGFVQPVKQKGYYASIGKELGAFSVGLGYANLKDGMKGGDDFAPGIIIDGNLDSNGKNLTTSAIVVPLGYAINDNLSLSATYIDGDLEISTLKSESVKEIDLGVEYAFNDNVSLSATYGDYNSNIVGNDQKNIEIALAITF